VNDSFARNPAEAEILGRIARRGAIPFVEFMELALYHPEGGYYSRPGATTGPSGDFSTMPDVSPDFGRRLAVQAAEVHERLGGGPWRLVELGPGRGLMAVDLLEGLARHAPEAFRELSELVLVERSPSLREVQRRRLAEAAPGVPARWVASLAELPERSVRGVLVGNEILDALPVHLVVRTEEGIGERWVTIDGTGRLVFRDGPVTDPAVRILAERYGVVPRVGDLGEVSPALADLVADVSRALAAGAAIFVDYGHPAAVLGDEAHREGTLLAYHRHRVTDDLLARPGDQDLTAHVNWDHLEDAARAAGLEVAGRTTQDRFLLALGIVEDMVAPGAEDDAAGLARALAARSLVLPGPGAGKRFEVEILVREVGTDLRGLADPFAGLDAFS